METMIVEVNKDFFKLVIKQPGVYADQLPVLARITNFFESNCWSIEDVRLAAHGSVGPHFCVGGDRYSATYDAETPEQADFVRSLLSQWSETPSDDGIEFEWCTFDGLVAGRTSRAVCGEVYVSNHPIFHTRKEAHGKLKEIAEFWAAWPHSTAEVDIVKQASAVKIDNPHRQLSESLLSLKLMVKDLSAPSNRPPAG